MIFDDSISGLGYAPDCPTHDSFDDDDDNYDPDKAWDDRD